MTLRVAINGFGRIGRNVVRAAKTVGADIDFIAANDLGDVDTMVHLLKYDSVYGRASFPVERTNDGIMVDGDDFVVLSERDPAKLPWDDLGVDVVMECTGIFKKRDQAAAHLTAGANRVIISAPSSDADAMFVMGVNDHEYDPAKHQIVSNASCTTNCFAPMMKVLDDAFGVEKGLITTIHAYTGTQNIVDGPHKDLRRSRAAAVNVIPTSTGAATATGQVLKHLDGNLDGIAMRTPLASGSITDFVGNLKTEVTADQVNDAYAAAAAADDALGKVLGYTTEPLVSSDIVGDADSCKIDGGLTMAMGNLVKVCGWYDNEWGYSNRMNDLAMLMASA